MSRVDERDRVRDSPERARSLFTVRAAISSARSVEAPRSLALSLMCSYWRARFVPFFTPRGGIASSFGLLPLSYPERCWTNARTARYASLRRRLRSRLIDLRTGRLVAALATASTAAAVDITLAYV